MAGQKNTNLTEERSVGLSSRVRFRIVALFAVFGAASVVAAMIGMFFIKTKTIQQPLTGYVPVPGTDLQILAGHPRMWVTPSTRDAMKCWAGITTGTGCGGNATIYQNFKAEMDEQIADGERAMDDIHRYALLYQLTGDSNYCTIPIEVARAEAQAGVPDKEGKGPARSSTVAIVYDWCYDRLSDGDKALIGQFMVLNAQSFPFDADHPFYPGESSGLVYAFSVFGDGINDAAVGPMLKGHYEGVRDVNIPSTNELYTNGGLDGYAGLRADAILTYAELFEAGSTYTTMFETSHFARNTATFFLHRTRGDLKLSKAPGKNNYSGIKLGSFLAHTAYRYNNTHAQWMSDFLIERNPGESNYELVLWRNPTVESTPLDDADNPFSLTLEGVGSGMYYGRSDWTFGSASQAIHWGFFQGPDLVGHKTANSFIIARGNDSLLIDGGSRTDDYDYTYDHYYRRSIAHNTIGITMPGEEFGTSRGIPIRNDGGQWNSDPVEGCLQWPAACRLDEDDGAGWRGEVKKYESVPGEYTYILSDATPAYNSEKTNQVERSFVELESDLFVVFDAVNATQASYEKALYMHMVEKPQVNGTLATQEGDYAFGGIFNSADSNVLTVTYGDSALLSKTLLPENPKFRIIGGQNTNGDPVRHNNSLIDYPPTYDPLQSYEYFNEWNWPPASLDNVGNYDDDQRYGRNGASSGTPAGGEAGDWRVEVRPGQATTFDNFLHVYQVRDGDLLVDNVDPGFSVSGTGWSQTNYNVYGFGMYADTLANAKPRPDRKATWSFTVTKPGTYDVNVYLPKKNSREFISDAKYTINHAGGQTVRTLNQNDGQALWINLGSYTFNEGVATVELSTATSSDSMTIIADALELAYQKNGLEMVATQLIRSTNQNMVGSFIDNRLLALFSKDGSEVMTTNLTVPASGEVDFRLFGMKADTNYAVTRDGQNVNITTGAGFRSTSQGALSFTLDFSGGEEEPAPSCSIRALPVTGYGPFNSYVEATFVNLPESVSEVLIKCSSDDAGQYVSVYGGGRAIRSCAFPLVTESTVIPVSAESGTATCSTDVSVLSRTDYITEYTDEYTVDISANPTINQGTIQNVEWDGVSSYRPTGSGSGEIPSTSSGLTALWRMNDSISDGVSDDASPNNNRAQCAGANCPTAASGTLNGAYQFDGVDDELDVASSASLNALDRMTASMWVKMTANQNNQTLLSFYKSATDRAYLWYTSEEGIRIFNDINDQGTSEIVTGYKPALNEWVHVAWVMDGSKWIIYINGQPYNSNEALTMKDLDDGFTVSIGRRSENDRPWKGQIDETAIWNRALSATEIQSLIGGGVSGPASFESNNIVAPEYDALIAQWSESSMGVKLEVQTEGESWCQISNGGILTNPNCPLPATHLKYRVSFEDVTSLDNLHLEWNAIGGGIGEEPTDDDPDGGGGKLLLEHYE